MNYTEIVTRQEEMQVVGLAMQKESQELQDMKIEVAQSHTSMTLAETLDTGLGLELSLDYDKRGEDIFSITGPDGNLMTLTVDQFNKIGQFLQKHNDVIFSYMSEITKTEDETDEEK